MSHRQTIRSEKNRGIAILLALLLGGIGAHKFYMGHIKRGLLYFLFCWTFIPLILSLVEVVRMVIEGDRNFQSRCR